MKKKISYKFIMSLLFSVVVLLELLSSIFHFSVNADAIIRIAVAVCGVLTVLGFIKKDSDDIINNLDDLKNYVSADKEEKTENKASETEDEKETKIDENAESEITNEDTILDDKIDK